jgi:hypothetical protein
MYQREFQAETTPSPNALAASCNTYCEDFLDKVAAIAESHEGVAIPTDSTVEAEGPWRPIIEVCYGSSVHSYVTARHVPLNNTATHMSRIE